MGQDQSLCILIAVDLSILSGYCNYYSSEEECAFLLSKYDFLFCIMAAKFVPGVCQQGSSTQSSKASFILSDLRLYTQGTIGRHYAFYWVGNGCSIFSPAYMVKLL